MEIPGTLDLTVTLQAQEWQTVLLALREMPYRLSNAVIAKLERGLNAAAQQQMAPRPGNGVDQQPMVRPDA